MNLSGDPVLCRNDSNLDFDWGASGLGGGVPVDRFSARWGRTWNFAAGHYRFHLAGDDGIRLWVDGNLIIDQWHDQARAEYTADLDLTAGSHSLKVEYYENGGAASASLWWEQPCPTGQYRAEYYSNRTLSGSSTITRCESRIDYAWGDGGPGNSVGADNFSARWTGRFNLGAGTYLFLANADDGIRVWVDGGLVIDGWKDQPPTVYQATRALSSGEHQVKVEYYEHGGGATAQVTWAQMGGCSIGQYRAEYYNNRTLSGSPTFAQCESGINYDWGSGGPGNGVGSDNFSVRWKGRFNLAGGVYTFSARADDGIRVWVDGSLIIDAWRDQPPTEERANRSLSSGEHEIKVEYYENGGGAVAQVRWERGGDVFSTGWEDGQPIGYWNKIQYSRSVAGYYNTWNPPPEAGRVTLESWATPGMVSNGGKYYLRVAGYSQAPYAYMYFRLFDTNITIREGMKLRYWIYNYRRSTFAIDGHFADGSTLRDFYNGDYLKDQNGVRIHPTSRRAYGTGQWHYVEVDLSRAAGRTLAYLMVAFDNGGDGYTGQVRAYIDNVSIGY
jgi:hypothetical protein